jgi:hypothetical protein
MIAQANSARRFSPLDETTGTSGLDTIAVIKRIQFFAQGAAAEPASQPYHMIITPALHPIT